MTEQTGRPISALDVADRLSRVIAVLGKMQMSRGQYPRTEAEISRELLALAEEHGATFEPAVLDYLRREAERYRD